VSLAIDALLAAGGVVVGRWLAKTLRAQRSEEASHPEEGTRAERDSPAVFPFGLGDVVVRTMERDEAWLAGGLVFEEEGPVAALFVAPEAGGDRALFVREGADGLTWLGALAAADVAWKGEPPHAIEQGGVRFERVRRLPVRVRRIGTGAPNAGGRAIVAEYSGPGAERIVVVAGDGQTLAWIGVAVGREGYEVLPGEKAARPAQ
jgi:hypothetical protein